MADVITDWRAALITALASQFANAEVASGRRQGVSRDKDRINVFASGEPHGHLADRVVVATPRLIVRYWKKRAELKKQQEPVSPQELEQAKNDLETFLRTKQTTLGVTNLWFFLVDSIVIDDDPEEWGIEARLTGYGKNVGAIA